MRSGRLESSVQINQRIGQCEGVAEVGASRGCDV
jgi:hypothetical protein